MARRLAIPAIALVILLMVLSTAVLMTEKGYAAVSLAWGKLRGGYTVDDRIAMHSSAVETRMKAKFEAAEVHFPPAELAYVAFKDTAQLQIYARSNPNDHFRLVHTYPVLGMSGSLGPSSGGGTGKYPKGSTKLNS